MSLTSHAPYFRATIELGTDFMGEMSRVEVFNNVLDPDEIVVASGDPTFTITCGVLSQGWWNYMTAASTTLRSPSRLIEWRCEQGLSTINCPTAIGRFYMNILFLLVSF